jgi:cytochrome c553
MKMKKRARGWGPVGLFLVVASVLALGVSDVRAFPTYTDCATCHGPFGTGFVPGTPVYQDWGTSLHTGHQRVITNCFVCHTTIGSGGPVFMSSSADAQFDISCVGCHGREQNIGNDSISLGRAAGLRQHHWWGGVISCADCHWDADPGNYTPVAEDIPPPNYNLNLSVVTLTDPCNTGGVGEDFAGSPPGLDNDGDDLYDEADVVDCPVLVVTAIPEPGQMAVLLLGIGLLLLIDRRRQRSQAM